MTTTATPSKPGMLRMLGRETDGIRRRQEPVTVGVPLPRGRVFRVDTLGLAREDGTQVPLQATITDRWSDGSARWALLDFAVDAEPRAETAFGLELRRDDPAPVHSSPVSARETSRGIFIDTGVAQFTIDRDPFLPFRSVRAGGVELVDPARSGWRLLDAAGNEWRAVAHRLELETSGPLRATVRVRGAFERPGEESRLELFVRLHFHAGSGAVRATITVRNPRRAVHPGGVWELGDPGSFLFRDLSLHVAARDGSRVSWSPDLRSPLSEARPARLEIYQDSSGGENWRSRVHLNAERKIPVSFRGFRVRLGDEERTGERATPRVAVHGGPSGVAASMRHFWQNFPKAMEAKDGVLTVRLFPEQFSSPHELQGGEQKTHELWLTFGPEATAPDADAQRCPLLVHPSPEWFEESGAVPYLTVRTNGDDLYERLVGQALEGDDTFEGKRELADEYGWRHFGETWADHESKYGEGEGTFISHYNNQYDVVYGAFLQFARSGDPRWYRLMEDLARHVVDIDVYHTDEDKPAYNRGLFWHTVHYVDGDLATHRSYPRGSVGGGPDNEHNYTTGLLHYHLLTGDPLGRETVIDSANWVIGADDGSRTVLKWLDRGPTGLASKTRDFDYHGPGRGSGNSINALLDGWRLTGDPRFLDKCDEIVRRTIHPEDDPEARRLLDAENRWSYTVHLQALGKYLDTKAEAGRLDDMYAWARESLLRYARWMAEHERPILETPDELEYPNETWAAQDIRKSDVLEFAALHAKGEERQKFLERGEWFFRHSLETLDGFDTKSYVRPVIILMHYGIMPAWLDQHPTDERPRPEIIPYFGTPVPFVPQKTRALRKLKWIVAAGGAVAVLAGAGLVLRAFL